MDFVLLQKVIFFCCCINFVFLLFVGYRVFFPSDNVWKNIHYSSEVAALVSPHNLRELIEEGTNPYTLVDVREPEHYELGHIIGAINIPPDARMVESFRELEDEGKNILVYCYTEVCMRGRKVGKELAENGIYVKELGIGFGEWKNGWREWNYEWEIPEINIDELIVVGSEPGMYTVTLEGVLKGSSGCGSRPGYEC